MTKGSNFIFRLLRILRGRRWLMAVSISFGLAFAATTLVPPLLIRRLIVWLTEGGGSARGLTIITLVLVGVYLVRGVCRYSYGRFSHLVAYLVLDDLMVRVYRHLQRLSHRFHDDQRTGSLIARSVNDIESIEDFIAHGIPETALAFLIPATMLGVLCAINYQLALLAFLPLPITAFIIFRFSQRMRKWWRQVRRGLGELVAQVQDNLAGMTEIKSFRRESQQAEMIAGRSAQFRDASIGANSLSMMPMGFIEMAGGLGVIVAVWLGGDFALEGRMRVADLFVFIVYLGHIYQPFLQLANLTDVIHKAGSSSERVFDLLDIEPEIVSAPDALRPANMKWEVEFRNVTFSYNGEAPVLHDVGFRVEEGKRVAVVGATGAGKTTVMRLVQRFYELQEGNLLIGGHDVRRLDLDFLRDNVSAVMQDVFLFHGSVKQNILFGRPDADEDEIVSAARAANAEEFILRLPAGYETMIGERGVRLSGGQKQRLSIARALLKDAPLLILDEATSAVDGETEALIQDALSSLTSDRTTLVISHRLSTIRNADMIVVLEQGRVVEMGAHDDLLARDGHFARMMRSQEYIQV